MTKGRPWRRGSRTCSTWPGLIVGGAGTVEEVQVEENYDAGMLGGEIDRIVHGSWAIHAFMAFASRELKNASRSTAL